MGAVGGGGTEGWLGSLPVGALTATLLPAKLPRAVPAAKPAARRQSTLLNLACCASPTHEGATMASKELPNTAACLQTHALLLDTCA